ncbi:hypothetical protein BDF21DRAFT_397480 [Thamnidium elegans]|nr:hypothetical protein BDF21DRAFT_397480 [Thamnidium elegans]
MKSSVLLYYIISLSNFFVVVYSNGQQDVNNCRKACSTDFLTKLVNLLNIEFTNEDYVNLNSYWTTCQYRCYRCSLNVGIQDMIELEECLEPQKINTPFSTIKIATTIYHIDQALEDCYNEWDVANSENDIDSVF